MLNVLDMVTCGSMSVDEVIPAIIHIVVLAIKIFIPVILIVFGMLDMGKAVLSNDEKTMKENQNKFIKRIVYAVIVFLVVAIVQTIFGILGTNAEADSAAGCIDCFVNNNCNQEFNNLKQ